MSKAIIYAGNSNTQTTTATGTVISFPTIVRRYGNLTLSGGNVVTKGSGYYKGYVNVTFEGTATGTAVFTVYKNGVAIPYANASRSTADATIYNITIPFADRNTCCCDEIITVVGSGVAVDVTNAAILIEKE